MNTQMAQLPRQGNHVSLLNVSTEQYEPLGKVMGFGTSNGEPIVIVQLDEPTYTEGGQHFISVMVVHLSGLALTSSVAVTR